MNFFFISRNIFCVNFISISWKFDGAKFKSLKERNVFGVSWQWTKPEIRSILVVSIKWKVDVTMAESASFESISLRGGYVTSHWLGEIHHFRFSGRRHSNVMNINFKWVNSPLAHVCEPITTQRLWRHLLAVSAILRICAPMLDRTSRQSKDLSAGRSKSV